MQDYNYVWYGCMEITLEISCCKYPPAYELPKYWEDNRVVSLQLIFTECLKKVHFLSCVPNTFDHILTSLVSQTV